MARGGARTSPSSSRESPGRERPRRRSTSCSTSSRPPSSWRGSSKRREEMGVSRVITVADRKKTLCTWCECTQTVFFFLTKWKRLIHMHERSFSDSDRNAYTRTASTSCSTSAQPPISWWGTSKKREEMGVSRVSTVADEKKRVVHGARMHTNGAFFNIECKRLLHTHAHAYKRAL